MNMKRAAPQNSTQRAVYAAVIKHGPIGVVDLAAKLGLTVQHASWHLRTLRTRGLVGPDKEAGRCVKWLTARKAAAARAEWQRVKDSLLEQKKLRADLASANEDEAIERWMQTMPTRRYVPAGQWQSQGLRQEWHP